MIAGFVPELELEVEVVDAAGAVAPSLSEVVVDVIVTIAGTVDAVAGTIDEVVRTVDDVLESEDVLLAVNGREDVVLARAILELVVGTADDVAAEGGVTGVSTVGNVTWRAQGPLPKFSSSVA